MFEDVAEERKTRIKNITDSYDKPKIDHLDPINFNDIEI